ncbi:AI-2E family transporter [Legionella anisa]|uniref:AI-2E family transporter n=1 Tax=Legionella anisa TaxID=28082 RepID=A0AAX0WVD0_9GAMM|nr:AI-2E family transporter [Legionella anisa]AWN73639.1 AI-2E family transporter [Legionella anisa]KTC75755.1 transporter [Legionella anisa]MBN5935607.1 AI-2E family transporter [Legionella anisa]MCW8426532.1 AI-2E family transporter [Legionella anisa]MCW8448195.1 AI-2E family transporter [Legionella anisa]
MSRTLLFTAGLIIIWIVGYFLIVGSHVLIPFVIAVFIWHLLNTISNIIQRIPTVGPLLPNWLGMIFAFAIVAVCIVIFTSIITNNVDNVIEASSRYQENLLKIFNNIDQKFNIKVLASMNTMIKSLNLQTIFVNVYGVFTTLMGSMVLILLYVVFLFVEQHFFLKKLDALFPTLEGRMLMNNIISHIVNNTQTYLGLKSILSIITALASWVVMKWVGLDFAEFWALLIFFLNFIPNIGAIIAIAFPTALAAIQFTSWIPFTEIILGLGAIQFIVGNLIEPRYLSNSLNLSPLVILIALAVWGAIWGILGMFLSVPITVMMMIIFAHFEKTRPIAILLSQDGDVFKTYELLPVENLPEQDWVQY